MATSVSNNAYGIISDALVDAGKLQEGSRPNSEQLASGMRRLNDLINLLQTQGLKLFLQEEIDVPLVTGQTAYIIGPAGPAVVMAKPTRITAGFITNTSNIRRPLVQISRAAWELLSQVVSNNGTINSFFVDKQSASLFLNVWPPPDATEVLNTATFLMQTQVTAPLALTDTMNFPQEWRIALRWGLADDLATGQPAEIMQRCQARATAFRTALEDWDVEDASTSFAPDSRMFNYNRSFK